MKNRSIGLVLAVAGAIAACAGAPDTSATSSDDAHENAATTAADLRLPTIPASRTSLIAADALAANDASLRGVAGFASHLTDDALLLARRQNLLQGKAAIVGFLTGAASPIPAGGTLGWRLVRGDVSALGDFGYTLGWLEIVGPQDADGNAVVSYSVYSATWRRGPGDWQIAAFSKTDLGGPPAAAPAGLLPLTGDGPVYPTLQGDAATAKELLALDTTFAAYSSKVGQQIGFDAYVDTNGISMNDPLIFGRKAIFDSNSGIPATSTLSWQPLFAQASRSGDLGFTVGTYLAGSVDADGAPHTSYGKYLTVWKRTADGSFKYIVDGGSSSPAPTTPP